MTDRRFRKHEALAYLFWGEESLQLRSKPRSRILHADDLNGTGQLPRSAMTGPSFGLG